MKIFTIKLVILLLFFQTATAQDTLIDDPYVGGVWTTDHNYIVSCDVLVRYDSVLTIHPGVKVYIRDGHSFTVEGQFIANGNQNNFIEIKPYQDESWPGMYFSSPIGPYTMRASQLSYIKFDCGNYLNSEAIQIGEHKINSINNIQVTNAETGITISGMAVNTNIMDCRFTNTTQGIVFKFCDNLSGILIDGCTFENISDKAIFITDNGAYLLDDIVIDGCVFDNSNLQDNSSESAIYIELNTLLETVSLNGNQIRSFGLKDTSAAGIFINDNENLGMVTISNGLVMNCGGEALNTPIANFGGIYINDCEDVKLDHNNFEHNTGLRSGAGFINARRVDSFDNKIRGNKNSEYEGSDYFGGAMTFTIKERIEMELDAFDSNVSNKSGGAFVVKSFSNADTIDLIFNDISLDSNNAESGGAALINAPIDTLKIFNSTLTDNFSSSSGGCFSVISNTFSELNVESNSIRNNYVSNIGDGGFLYLAHIPQGIIPSYGSLRFHNNTDVADNHLPKNYSILYCSINSFPDLISITHETVIDFFPVTSALYTIEHPQSLPYLNKDTSYLTIADNYFANDTCPVFYLVNDSCTLSAGIHDNEVLGNAAYPGKTFINLKCNRVTDLDIQRDNYNNLYSDNTSGGAISISTNREIGNVVIDSLTSQNCYSAGGNGGHISLTSNSSDPATGQQLIITNSSFSSINKTTNGNGGAVYYHSEGDLSNLLIRSCQFTDLKAKENGGALFVNAKEIFDASFVGTSFQSASSTESAGGAVYINAHNGNVSKLILKPFNDTFTTFSYCASELDGGAIFVKASKEIGPVEIDSVDIENCYSNGGNGGHIYLFSSATASPLQKLIIANSHFQNTGNSSNGDGGSVYYNSQDILDSLFIRESVFTGIVTKGSGGALFIDSKAINEISIKGSQFISNSSEESAAGAIYANARNGGIKKLSVTPFNNIRTSFSLCSADSDGGAMQFKASKELGPVLIDSVEFIDCYSGTGNGGYLSLVSESSDQTQTQDLVIKNSDFSNSGSKTGGKGGAVYYNAHEKLDSLIIQTCSFSGLKADSAGGSVFVETHEIDSIKIVGSTFISNSSNFGSGGAIYVNTTEGNIKKLSIFPYVSDNTSFTSCTSKQSGGAVFIKAAKEIGPAIFESVQSENCKSSDGDGGYFALISNGSDNALAQELIMTNTSFSDGGQTGGNGGAVYYKSHNNLLESLYIQSCLFSNLSAGKKAGALFASVKEINDISILGSGFISNSSQDSVAGAVFINAGNGNINNLSIVPFNGNTNEFSSCTSKSGGGALYIKASNVIGNASIDSAGFKNCRTTAGNGGSIYMSANKINSISISSSTFNGSVSSQSGGAVYLKSIIGILDGTFSSDEFTNCSANQKGGVFYIEDGNFDNIAESITWSSNIYRKEAGGIAPDQGGGVYCKGIRTITILGDSVMDHAAGNEGGFLFLDHVLQSNLNGVYANGNLAQKGAVVYHQGYSSNLNETSGIFNSKFLFNNAEVTGGCFYMANIDSIEIGKPGNLNVFVANQALMESNESTIGGGAFYIQDAQSLDINSNSFYINKSKNNGGVGIINTVSDSLRVENNSFVANQARIGGAITFINDLPEGLIANNKFYQNSATIEGGALLYYLASAGNFEVRDNTFFKNNSDYSGGAIASYRPLRLIRNLFTQNLLNLNDPLRNQGPAVSFNDNGIQSVIKNCVFDNNAAKADSVAGIYFGNSNLPLPALSIANCTFFNHDEKYRSVYNSKTLDTVNVINSIFNLKAKAQRLDVKYFNGTVKARYCDLIHSKDSTNHNYDEYFIFNNGDYYFDSLQPYPLDTVTSFPINHGDPDPIFNDRYLPAGYWTKTNDLGVSGGPDNPSSTESFLFNEPGGQAAQFDVVVKSSDCFDYSFECLGDSVVIYDYFYWFLPDTIIRDTSSRLQYTFSSDLEGDQVVTVLGHDNDNLDNFGYGHDTINLDIIRIHSLASSTGSNSVSVPATPFQFSVIADIYIADNADNPVSDWKVISSQGTEFELVKGLSTLGINLIKITGSSGFINIEYLLEACGRPRKDTIEIQLTTINWGYPEISFFPSENEIPNITDSIEIVFNQRMADNLGHNCGEYEADPFLNITYSDMCEDQDIEFLTHVVCKSNETRFVLVPVDAVTHVPAPLCDGEYYITVYAQNLVTENYQLAGMETQKPYFLDIYDLPADQSVKVYPNPLKDKVHIEFDIKGDYLIKITDLTGHVQKSVEYEKISEVTLDLSGLSEGMHMLDVKNLQNSRQMVIKIIKITH